VAEQFRYDPVYDYIVSIVPQIGKFNYFVQQVNGDVDPGDKYFETSCRGARSLIIKGDFLLDSGVQAFTLLRDFERSYLQSLIKFQPLHVSIENICHRWIQSM